MSNLLIDIGNTLIKWAVEQDGQLSVGEEMPSSAEGIIGLMAGPWQAIEPRRVLVSCVAHREIWDILSSAVQRHWSLEPWFLSVPAQACGIRNAYREPQTMGPDRWAAMVAAYHRVQGAVCVVGCGTAMTLDVVDGQGHHQGGLILPGYHLQQQCITQHAANIRTKQTEALQSETGLGQSSLGCLQQGSIMALRGAIGQVLAQPEYAAIALLMTGGDAKLVAEGLPWHYRLEPHLVLQGLALILRSQEKDTVL